MVTGGGQRRGNHRSPKKRLKPLVEFMLGAGPQPIESILGVICEAFNCTPDVAMAQDLRVIRKILDARLLESAKAQHNEDATKMTEAQTSLWTEAIEAANG